MSEKPSNILNLLSFLILIFALTTVATVYWPGLSGPFILDDRTNLQSLAVLNQDSQPLQINRYLHSHNAGLFGRPISRLSFLLDDWAWPSNPKAFKLTNLKLHLITSLLIFYLYLTLGRAIGLEYKTNLLIASASAFFWATHPLNVSTTLYIVQRMTILSAMFSVLSLIFYINARNMGKNNQGRAIALFTLSILSIIAAILSKENAAIIPLSILILEGTLIRTPPNFNLPLKKIFISSICATSILVALNYAVVSEHLKSIFFGAYADRFFNLHERLLTETRVLLHYIFKILVPNISGLGVYHDDFSISRSITDPPSTLFSLISLAGITAISIAVRKRMQILSFSMLFFLSGHAIESSFIPLEIYYEHRNYLPMVGLIYGVFYYLFRFLERSEKKTIIAMCITTSAYLANNVELTYKLARIWQSKLAILEFSAMHHPKSVRVHFELSNILLQKQQPHAALRLVNSNLKLESGNLSVELEKILIQCMMNGSKIGDIDSVVDIISSGFGDIQLLRVLGRVMKLHKRGACRIEQSEFERIFSAIEGNGRINWSNRTRAEFYVFWGYIERIHSNFISASGKYRFAVSFGGNNERFFEGIAFSEFGLGDIDEAYKAATTALEIHNAKGFKSMLTENDLSNLELISRVGKSKVMSPNG